MTIEEIRDTINKMLPFTEEQITEELNICCEIPNETNVKKLTLLTQIATTRSMHNNMKRILDIAIDFLNKVTDESRLLNLYYVLTSAYYILGFPPKVVEYGEKYLLLNGSNHAQTMVVYNYLTFVYKTQGFLEKAIEYNNKAYDEAIAGGAIDTTAIGILIHLNNMFVYMSLKNDEMVNYEFEQYLNISKEHPDNPYIQIFSFSFEVATIFKDLYFNLTTDNINRYLEKMYYLEANPNTYIMENVDSHLELVQNMFKLGMYQECIKISKILLHASFIGDKLDLYYYYLESIKKIDNYNIEEYENIKNEYIEQLQNLKTNYTSFINHLINEQLNYLTYMSDYENKKKKFELDALTSCLNRPAFEQDFEIFVNKNPQGCLVFVDLDHLKKVNDEYGHKIGDLYLKTFVNDISKHLDNEMMKLYRYAGDEFIILSKLDLEKSNQIIDQAYLDCKNNSKLEDTKTTISFSYGISPFTYQNSIEEIIHNADKIMYEYKKEHHRARKN